MPEAAEPVVAVHGRDDGHGPRSGATRARARARAQRHLQLAFDELDGREQQAGEGAARGAAGDERAERQGGGGGVGGVQGGAQGGLRDAVAEEEAAGLDGGAEEGGADAAVEAGEAVGAEGLLDAVEGAGIEEREGRGLGLQPDFYGVEGVFDRFADDACDLRGGVGELVGVVGKRRVEGGGGLTDPKVMSFRASRLGLLCESVGGGGVPLSGWADTEIFRSTVSVIEVGDRQWPECAEGVGSTVAVRFPEEKERPGLWRLLRRHGGRWNYEAIRIFGGEELCVR